MTLNDTLRPYVSLKWRKHELKGIFVEDPLHILSYCPLTLKHRNTTVCKLQDIDKKWYRMCLFPYFLQSNNKCFTMYTQSIDTLKRLYEKFLVIPISSLSQDFLECSVHEKYFLIYMFSIGDEKKIFVAMLLYTIACKESQTQANAMLKASSNTHTKYIE